jgi:DNA replication protein DnaC
MAMTADELEKALKLLKLHYLAESLDDLVAQATKGRWGPREVIEAVIAREVEEQTRRSIERRTRDAHIGRFKPMSEFDWAWPTSIDREQIERLLDIDWIGRGENWTLGSAQGLGKTMIAKNVAHLAALAGRTVLFTTAAAMLLDLRQQESPRALQSRLRRYTSPSLLVIDEVGYLSHDAASADLLFNVVSRRYETAAILLTTNLSFGEWPQHFPGAACVTAMIDRLTHHGEVATIEGKSYRLKEAQERKAKRAKKA